MKARIGWLLALATLSVVEFLVRKAREYVEQRAFPEPSEPEEPAQ